MDPALLSKIEHGSRLPTQAQTTGLARYLGVPEAYLQAHRIAVDFLTRYREGIFAREAIAVIREGFRIHGADTDK